MTTLSYASAKPRRLSKFALTAFLLGIAAGPLQIGVIYIAGLIDSAFLNGFTVFAPPVIAFVLNVCAVVHIRATPTVRGLAFAITGGLFSIAWPIALIIIFLRYFPTC